MIDDRHYLWVPGTRLDAIRALNATVGGPNDDGDYLCKLRAPTAAALPALPPDVRLIARTEQDRANRDLSFVRAEVIDKTKFQRAIERGPIAVTLDSPRDDSVRATAPGHGYFDGLLVQVNGTNWDGTWPVRVGDADHFVLEGASWGAGGDTVGTATPVLE